MYFLSIYFDSKHQNLIGMDQGCEVTFSHSLVQSQPHSFRSFWQSILILLNELSGYPLAEELVGLRQTDTDRWEI